MSVCFPVLMQNYIGGGSDPQSHVIIMFQFHIYISLAFEISILILALPFDNYLYDIIICIIFSCLKGPM